MNRYNYNSTMTVSSNATMPLIDMAAYLMAEAVGDGVNQGDMYRAAVTMLALYNDRRQIGEAELLLDGETGGIIAANYLDIEAAFDKAADDAPLVLATFDDGAGGYCVTVQRYN